MWAGKVLECGAGGVKAAGTVRAFISCDLGTQQKAASTAKVAHVCSWAGVKSISALEGQDFVTYLQIPTASPALQILEYERLIH